MSLALSLLGGGVFVASLVFFAYTYLGPFGRILPATGSSAWPAVVWNTVIFSVFALHHSIFARTGLKARVMKILPPALERSFYVWISSTLFLIVCLVWQPVPGMIWQVAPPISTVLIVVQIAAGVLAVMSARRLDVFELAGIRQVLGRTRQSPRVFDDSGPYALVRHPIYLGWWAFVWLTPVMTGTRLVFAIVSCAYLVLAVPYEERDLRRTFGQSYERYCERVRWRLLPFVY
jgi:protein-S-isoprenylcysteine O-methyltransferase Ste14